MKVFAGRSGCLGKDALNRKAKRRRGLPFMRGLAACALGIAVAAMLGAAAERGGVPGTDGKWHSLTSGKAYLPADVPCGVEDSFSALPPATAAAEEELDASENGTAHDNLAPC